MPARDIENNVLTKALQGLLVLETCTGSAMDDISSFVRADCFAAERLDQPVLGSKIPKKTKTEPKTSTSFDPVLL